MIRVTDQGKVIYLARRKRADASPGRRAPTCSAASVQGVARNFQVFDALDFIAELTQHVPDPRKHLVRYFGFYSNKSRGLRAKTDGDGAHRQQATGSPSAHDAQSPAPQTPSANTARRRWAALIKRVWHVDPLRCPSCGSAMRIVSFIEPTQPDVIRKILAHCGLPDEPPRAPPRAPPPPTRELQYVSDLEFVHDPGPAEPVWSPD